MPVRLDLGGVTVDVVRKDIKNVVLSVYPPTGRVRVSAPLRMNIETIRLFAIAKLGWIRKHQKSLREQEREGQREYVSRESHHIWGRRYLLKIVEEDVDPKAYLQHSRLVLQVRPGADAETKEAVLASWHRHLVRTEVPRLIAAWEPRLGVKVSKFYVRKMKTKWGSCNPVACTIRLNTELAKKPRECLEYIVLHEMVHLLEPTHGSRFLAMMDRFMPSSRETRQLLNRLPGRRERWEY
jgi:predicted metal-dependent hydrolase